MPKGKSFEHLSARILELYIELNDYAYFHGPSEVDHLDRRFRGRTEILERLKSLLTHHESPSGSYLVTGFRGAGKSSLVAKALSEITPSRLWVIGPRRVLRILSPVLASTLLNLPVIAHVLLATAFLGILVYLAWADPRRPDLQTGQRRRPRLYDFVRATGRALVLESEKPPSSRKRAFWQDGLAICLLVVVGAILPGAFFPKAARALCFLTVLVLSVVYLYIPPILNNVPLRTILRRKASREWLADTWVQVRDFRLFGRRVHVQINLGQDNLREVDILRSIASSLESEYLRFMRPSLQRLFFRSLLFLPFLAIAFQTYPTLEPWARDIKTDLHLPCYLPSQGYFLLGDKIVGEKAYLKILKKHYEGLGGKGTDELRKSLDKGLSPEFKVAMDSDASSGGFSCKESDGWLGVLQRDVQSLTTGIDSLVQILWDQGRSNVLVPVLSPVLGQGKGEERDLQWLPQTLDYFFFSLLALAWVLTQIALRRSFFRSPGHKHIYRRIRELNEMIAAEVTQERGGVPIQANTLLSFSFGKRRRQIFKVLNEREIEKRLTEILRLCTRVNPLDIRPELIIVFDELDKIQHRPPEGDVALGGQTLASGEVAAGTQTSKADLGITDVERDRQHRILSLVSNLKHFLSTAPAKFIFIAGREMFDAALADVSDRHFFMGSVFNEVLHVPSFHSDDSDDRLPDITSLPEQYLCRFLIPKSWPCNKLNLGEFYRYLKASLLPDPPDLSPSESGQEDEDNAAEVLRAKEVALLARQRNKILYELHNFVTYLTYRSNGAPKRITSTLERFICPLPKVDRYRDPEKRDPRHFVVGHSRRSLYLRFRYQDQYTFGLTTYLASPLIFSVNRAIKDYGDKILVSSSFVLDHIFKFHGHGFSWRSLELLPEVVDINRAPQLRELISHIMRFLARGQVNEIISGLYHFKFTRRITEEIGILSKLSEHESAAFNFTLDESLALKRHFYRQLKNLLAVYKAYPNQDRNGSFINSVAFLRMILGDLHYYDGEYDSAIIEYMEAVQALRDVTADKSLRPDLLVLMTRNFLKLGLAFERKKAFDSALVTYGRIAAVIDEISQRHHRREPVRGESGVVLLRSSETAPDDESSRLQFDSVLVESMRLIYQPMLARLQLLEKATLGGICFRDLRQVKKEFGRILGPEKADERFLAVSEFHNKVGDILFFKNGPEPDATEVYCRERTALCFENRERGVLLQQRRRLPCLACHHYHEALAALCLSYLGIEIRNLARGEVLVLILKQFENSTAETLKLHQKYADRPNFIREVGDVISDLGDTFVSCAYLPRKPTALEERRKRHGGFLERLCVLLSLGHGSDEENDEVENRRRSEVMGELASMIREGSDQKCSDTKVLEALAHFAVATILFRLATNNRAASIQLIKILWLVREVLAVAGYPVLQVPSDFLRSLGHQAIRELHRSHEGTHRLEIEKLKEILKPDFVERSCQQEEVDLSRLSINANITEVLVVIQEIRMLLDSSPRPLPLADLCSPYAMFHSVYSRIQSLRLRSRIHWRNFGSARLTSSLGAFFSTDSEKRENREEVRSDSEEVRRSIKCLGANAVRIGGGPIPKQSFPEQGVELLEMVLVDASYCCHEIIRLLRIYGRSYMASNSMKAAAHADMASWCNYLYAYIRFCVAHRDEELQPDLFPVDPEGLQPRLERALGPADMVHLSPNYHREMALSYWKGALETHSEGRAYQELLEDMFYLNDDFADSLEHFCASVERFRINSGLVDMRIRKATSQLASTVIYDPWQYFSSLGKPVDGSPPPSSDASGSTVGKL